MVKREVWLGTRGIAGKTLTHWAIKVGDSWYEIDGAGKKNKGDANTINGGMNRNGRFDCLGAPTYGTYYSRSRAERQQLICTTHRSDHEIEQFNRRWLRNNPTYGVIGANCQKYVIELAEYLSEDGYVNLPVPEGGEFFYANGPGAFASDNGNRFVSSATTGKVSANGLLVVGTEVEGPSGAVCAGLDNDYAGAMVRGSLGRAEVRAGPVRARVEPNIDTGLGIIDGNAEVKLLGFGGSIGSKGLGISTPFGGFNLFG